MKVRALLLAPAVLLALAACNDTTGTDNNAAVTPPSHTSSDVPTSSSAPAIATTTSKSNPPASDLSDKDWKASDIQVENSQFGTSVTAEITNAAKSSRSGIFTITIYMGDKRIYNAQGAAQEVSAGQTVTVTFIGTTDKLPGVASDYTYKFQCDTTF